MLKGVVGVSVISGAGTGGGPPGHVSTVAVGAGVWTDVLPEFEQAVTAHTAKIHGRERTEK
jgi:hypothetical protein